MRVFVVSFNRRFHVINSDSVDLMVWIPVWILMNISAEKGYRADLCWFQWLASSNWCTSQWSGDQVTVWTLYLTSDLCVGILFSTLFLPFRKDTATGTKSLVQTSGCRANLPPTPRCPPGITYPRNLFWTPAGMKQLWVLFYWLQQEKKDALFLWSNSNMKSTPVLFVICHCILSASIVKL